jgi:ribosome-associated protein
VSVLKEKEAEEIVVLNMSGTNLLTDYFIICTANSDVHMRALTESAINCVKENELKIIYADRQKTGEWMLVDTGEFVVHVFSKKGRQFYALDDLWRETERIKLN